MTKPDLGESKPAGVWLDAGQTYTLRFECNRCESYRWRAVNPGRNVRRALKALDEGDEQRARDRLATALEDLEQLAQWAKDDSNVE